MSVGLIKSGGYVPCGASATLMSQYPMKPATDIIELTNAQLNNGWTAPCAGELSSKQYINSSTGIGVSILVNGVTVTGSGTSGSAMVFPMSIIVNKDDVVAYDRSFTGGDPVVFRPFAVGEVL